jgi:hypothetical protein
MTPFLDLWRASNRPAAAGTSPDSAWFTQRLAQSRRLRAWSAEDWPNGAGLSLVLGVAPWSGYDMALLDLIERAVPPLPVFVCDLSQFTDPKELRQIAPGIRHVTQSPVVALWSGSSVLKQASGFEGRKLAAELCGLDPELLQRAVESVPG